MKSSKNAIRVKRHWRLRKHINGTAERPRLNVFRSLNNIYAQVIDDVKGETLVSASTLDKELKGQASGGNKAGAALVGKLVAERAVAKGITTVVFRPRRVCLSRSCSSVGRRGTRSRLEILIREETTHGKS